MRWLAGKILPETSALYRFLYLHAYQYIVLRHKNRRLSRLEFGVWVTDVCNLNCSYCNVYSPLAVGINDDNALNVDLYRQNIKRMQDLAGDDIGEISLFGGEPLLHPRLIELIEISREHAPKGKVSIITNGILLHKAGDDFWRCCYENKVLISITPYPIKLNMERIMDIADGWGVELAYVYAGEKSTFRKLPLDITGRHDIKKNYKLCPHSACRILRNEKMFACTPPNFVHRLNEHFGTRFEVTTKDYIDIHKVRSKEEIFDYFRNPIPFCRYCDMGRFELGVPWSRSKKELSEWVS